MKAAVAVISFFDNEILQKIVEIPEGSGWKVAYIKALSDGIMGDAGKDEDHKEWVLGLPDDLSEARGELGNGEMDLCVTLIP